MSHGHERAEKICLNCGASLHGRYCHACGQENVEPKESVGQLARHFFEDITHFDGKFFSTIKYLITRPGFLPQEYLAGRRARYLHPIRMYLFISFIFFFAAAMFIVPKISRGNKTVKNGDTMIVYGSGNTQLNKKITIKDGDTSLAQYDARQKLLPESERDGKITRYLERGMLAALDKGRENPNEFIHRLLERFFHSLPQMLFILLPLFALVLQLLYIRRRKQYNYVSQAVFTIYFYCFLFMGMFLMLFASLNDAIAQVLNPIIFLGMLAYLYIAMLRFYKQGWLKTLIKYFILNVLVFFITAAITGAYALNAFISAGT